MAAETRIHDIQGFSGGESDDITRWPKDSFYSGENIEVRKDLSWIKLTPKLVDTWWSISGDIIFMENLAKFWYSWIVVATDTGNVYLNGTLKTTLSTGTTAWNRIMDMWVNVISWTSYFYFCTQTSSWEWKIHRSTTNLTTWNVSYRSFTTANLSSPKVKWISTWFGVYFAVNNCVVLLDNTETTSIALELPKLEEIYWFTYFQNNFKIYTNFGNQGVQYYWDWIDTAPSYRQVWDNQNILDVVNNWAYDYAILGFKNTESYNDLYIISGTQKEPVRVNLEANTYSRIFDWYMSVREDIIYISGGKSGESDNYWVFTYGNYYPWTQKSLTQSYSHNSTNKVLMHVHDIAASYFATQDDKVYQVTHNNPPTNYATSWYVISQIYSWNIWEEMKIDRIKVWFSLELWTSFKIWHRKEIWGTWKLVKEFDYATFSSRNWYTISYRDFAAQNIWNMYTWQIKIELFSNNGYTPIIKRVTTFYTTINE